MRLKLDENLSRHLASALAPLGHDVSSAADEGLLSEPDEVVAEAAKVDGRVLLTLDVESAVSPGRTSWHHPLPAPKPRAFDGEHVRCGLLASN